VRAATPVSLWLYLEFQSSVDEKNRSEQSEKKCGQSGRPETSAEFGHCLEGRIGGSQTRPPRQQIRNSTPHRPRAQTSASRLQGALSS
jgi:hypothetical protein